VTLATVRAARAETLASTLRVNLGIADAGLIRRDQEIDRLKAVIEAQQAEITALRERLKEVEELARQATLDAVVHALAAALDRGSEALENMVVSTVHAELKAAFQLQHGSPGLLLAGASTYGPEALSTVRFDLRRIPPTPADEARRAALDQLVAALLRLQSALDRDLPAGAADPAHTVQAHISSLTAAPPPPDELKPRLDVLVAAVSELGVQLPEVAPAAGTLADRHAALPAPPERPDAGAVASVAQAVIGVADALEES
jgi:hypothetical protein